MPLYEYQCEKCGATQDRFCSIAERPDHLKCGVCKGNARRVFTAGYGGIRCDSINDVKWMPSALKVLQPDHEKPIETRGEYNRYLRDRQLVCKG